MFQGDKKGISTMISYVLLISIVIGISAGVYIFMKSFVPQDKTECPEETSIAIEELSCDEGAVENNINVKVTNNGKFSIGGYFIRVGDQPEQQIATIDISEYGGGSGGVVFISEGDIGSSNALSPGRSSSRTFSVPTSVASNIYLLEIIPIRYDEEDNKLRSTVCGEAKISEKVECTIGGA